MSTDEKRPSAAVVVTLDGPAGVGKTTLARAVAEALGVFYMDTGAMFRCLALRLGPGAEQLPPEKLREACGRWTFSLEGQGNGTRLLCNGEPVGDEIRTERVGMLASRIAAVPVVREVLLEAQRSLASAGSLVAEGRDMGTEVFPRARHKFFLDAAPEVRARRRLLELRQRGEEADVDELAAQIRRRDDQDRNRAVAPLRPATDAVVIDTSALNIDEVRELILRRIRERTDAPLSD